MRSPVLLAILLLFLATGCRYEEIKLVSVDAIEIISSDGSSLLLEVTASIDNPNNARVKLTGAELTLSFNKVVMGSGRLKEPVIIRSNGTYPTRFLLLIKTGDSLESLMSSFGLALLTGRIEVGLSGVITGKSRCIKRSFPVNISEEISLGNLLEPED